MVALLSTERKSRGESEPEQECESLRPFRTELVRRGVTTLTLDQHFHEEIRGTQVSGSARFPIK